MGGGGVSGDLAITSHSLQKAERLGCGAGIYCLVSGGARAEINM